MGQESRHPETRARGRRARRPGWLVVLPCALLASSLVAGEVRSDPVAAALPMVGGFLENQGQWMGPSRFRSSHGRLLLAVEPQSVVLGARGEIANGIVRHSLVRLSFVGSSPDVAVEGVTGLPGACHVLLGSHPSGWRTDLTSYEAVRFESLYPGIDAALGVTATGVVQSFEVSPTADVSTLDVLCEGVREIRTGGDGALGLVTDLGDLRLVADGSQQRADGSNQSVVVRPKVSGNGMKFEVAGDRDPALPVTISLGLQWSTFLGGSGGEHVSAVGLTPDGRIVAVGGTTSLDFPTTPGVHDSTLGPGEHSEVDLFVSCLDAAGSQLLWSTYLGGSNKEEATAVLVEDDGSIVLAGRSTSVDYPITPGAYKSVNELGDGFLTKLNATGSGLEFSTFLGGEKGDWIYGMARGQQGEFVVVGSTLSTGFPTTTGAIQPAGGAFPGDAFLAKVASDGSSLLYGTYLGGSASENAFAVAVAGNGIAYIVGATNSPDFPTTPGAYDETHGGSPGQAFISAIDMEAGSLVASTLFGGPGLESPTALGIDSHGDVVICGDTSESVPTTPDALDPTANGFEDCFIARLDSSLQTLRYATHVGGSRRDFAGAIRLEPSGAIVVAGNTDSLDFPTTQGAFQEQKATAFQDRDLFVFRLAPDGQSLHYGSYLGGTEGDGFDEMGLAVDSFGAAVVGAFSTSRNFPVTPGSFAPVKGAFSDAIIAKLSLLPLGVGSYGWSTPGCTGLLTMGVTSIPAIESTTFALTCSNAPALEPGLVIIGLAALDVPTHAGGSLLWIDPASLLVIIPVISDDVGYVELPMRIPGDGGVVGLQVFAQTFWKSACPAPGLSASHPLAITVQP